MRLAPLADKAAGLDESLTWHAGTLGVVAVCIPPHPALQGFALNTAQLRPSSAPPMYAHVGSTAVPRDQKLCTFLRSVRRAGAGAGVVGG